LNSDLKKKKVTVLLPLRNSAATLAECLASLRAQTFADFEVVAVDHASTDETPQILSEFAHGDRRLRLIRLEGGSLIDALNAGLAEVRTEFTARMDGDDVCLPQRLERQLLYMEANPQTALCGSWVELFPREALGRGYLRYESWIRSLKERKDIERDLFIECPLPHPTWFFRTRTVREAGGYRDLAMPEDYELLLRLEADGYPCDIVPEVLLKWREHGGRHSKAHPRYSHRAFFNARARYLDPIFLKGRPAVVWGNGGRARLLTQGLLRQGVKVLLVIGFPSKVRRHSMAGVPLVLPEQAPAVLPGAVVACVGTPGANAKIARWAQEKGLVPGQDLIFAS
jgi:glycosyltransferase involved in cell wall biosynthesis